MNKKGFTLIEVMATVLIIAAIATISYPVLTNLSKNNSNTKKDSFQKNATLAAKTYFNLNEDNDPDVLVSDLILEGFLDKPNFDYDYTNHHIQCTDTCIYLEE